MGVVLSSSSFGDAAWCHSMLFCSGGQNYGTGFHYQSQCSVGGHCSWQIVIEPTAWHIRSWPFMLLHLQCVNPVMTNFPVSQIFVVSCTALCLMPCLHYFPNHCSSVFYNECINFLLIVFCGGDSLSTVASQISSVCFTKRCTWLTPMQESPLAWHSQSEMFAVDLFSFMRISVTGCRWNNNHFATVDYG
jgi:hypothetical protein